LGRRLKTLGSTENLTRIEFHQLLQAEIRQRSLRSRPRRGGKYGDKHSRRNPLEQGRSVCSCLLCCFSIDHFRNASVRTFELIRSPARLTDSSRMPNRNWPF